MNGIVDYAYPTMMAERALKELHEAFLGQRLDIADQKAKECVEWLLEARFALKVHADAKAKG